MLRIFLTLLILSISSNIFADDTKMIDAQKNYAAIGEYVQYLKESETPLDIDQVKAAYSDGSFSNWDKPVLGFGIGTSAVWLRFTIQNESSEAIQKLLIVENSWMDDIDVFIFQDDNRVYRREAGDTMPFTARGISHRFFVFEHRYTPGTSIVYLRAATPDPMILPIFFGDEETSKARDISNAYSYGMLYGILLALLLYNLLLFLSIKQSRYFYYVIYLLMFLFMNFSYTGHGYSMLWPDSPTLQRWINPFAISLFSTSGILFAFAFLNIRKLFPGLYKKTFIFCILFWLMQVIFILSGMQAASVIVAIAFVSFFSIFTFYAAVICLKRGHRDAIYYLIATIATLFGTAITALTVWGLIPYSTLTFRAAEIAISIDALLLSMALAEQIRRAQKEKLQAQELARVDLLTNLYNRRAFNEISAPIWHSAIRHRHQLCIMLLDIDKFKSINDNYGHATGDQVLRKVSSALVDIVRDGDILARWGGEEFAIMLPMTPLEQATIMAERIRETIAELDIVSEKIRVKTTVSIGVAQKDSNTHSIDKLLMAADAGLYQAKNSGRNRVCTV